MRLPRRHTLWLSAVLLLVVIAGLCLSVPRSQITQENYDRIHRGMSEAEVIAILGRPESSEPGVPHHERRWQEGPSWIVIGFYRGRVELSAGRFATAWEKFIWYAKRARRRSA